MSKDLVVANNGAMKTVPVHLYHRNHAARQSDDNMGPVTTAVVESRDQDFPVTSLNHDDGDEANKVNRPTLVASGMPCS